MLVIVLVSLLSPFLWKVVHLDSYHLLLAVLIPSFFVRNKSLDCFYLVDDDRRNGLLPPRIWFFTRNCAAVVPSCSSPLNMTK